MVLWGRSVLVPQKVPRKVSPRFHQASPSFVFVVFLVVWGRSVLGCQKVPRKVSPRFHRGSAKVSRRLRKFGDLSGLLGQIPFCRGSPHHFFTFASQFLHLFFACFWTELALGSSAIVKVLWQNDTFVF